MVHACSRMLAHCLTLLRVLRCLQEWCRGNAAELLAVQPPGRNMRMREQPITTCRHMAAALLSVVASRLTTTPYVVSGHSAYPCLAPATIS